MLLVLVSVVVVVVVVVEVVALFMQHHMNAVAFVTRDTVGGTYYAYMLHVYTHSFACIRCNCQGQPLQQRDAQEFLTLGIFHMLRILALRLALWDAGCNIARYVLCIICSAYGVCDVHITKAVFVQHHTQRRTKSCMLMICVSMPFIIVNPQLIVIHIHRLFRRRYT